MTAPIRQQFTLAADIDEKYNLLATKLGKKPNDLKKEILTAMASIPSDAYYMALGMSQQVGRDSAKAKKL